MPKSSNSWAGFSINKALPTATKKRPYPTSTFPSKQVIRKRRSLPQNLHNGSDNNDAQTWYLLGRCYMAQSKFNKAYDSYQQAV